MYLTHVSSMFVSPEGYKLFRTDTSQKVLEI